MDGQEIGGQAAIGDEGQLLRKQSRDLGRRAVWIADQGAASHQFFQPALGLPSRRHGLLGVFILQVVKVEGRARQEGGRLGHRLGRVPEQPRHFVPGFQPAFGIGFQPTAGGFDGRAFADTGQDVLQISVFGGGVEDVVQRQQGNICSLRHGLEPRQPAPVAAAPVQDGAQPDGAGRRRVHAGQSFLQPCQPIRGDEDQQQVFRIGQQVAQPDLAFALPGAAIAQCQQARQSAPARTSLRIGDDVGRPVVEDQPRSGQQAKVRRMALHLFGQGRIVQRVLDEGDLAGTAAVAHLVRWG